MKTIILGPPGTGKTTTLLDLVDEFIKAGVDTKRIGYFSFTKKAANEAKQRAVEKFGLDEKDFPYFRTLHSLAFGALGLSKSRVMQSADYKDFGSKCGIPITIKKVYNSEEDGTFTSDNEYLQLIEKARAAIQKVAREQGFEYVIDATPGGALILSDGKDLMADVKKELGF